MTNWNSHKRGIHRFSTIFVFLTAAILLLGCQGRPSDNPPIHLNPNMDHQPKYRPQSSSPFFADGAAMRSPVEGTIAYGELHDDDPIYTGVDPQTGDTLRHSPVPVTMENLEYGRERFNIYCAVCHGQAGDGSGLVVRRGYIVPPSFHTDQIREYRDGTIFRIITEGIRNMPAYADQIPPEDRWMIVNYLRALQRSQATGIEDLPEDIRAQLEE